MGKPPFGLVHLISLLPKLQSPKPPMLLQLNQSIWENSIFWFHVFFFLKMHLQSLWSSDQACVQNTKGSEKYVLLTILGMGMHLKAGVGSTSFIMENVTFHFHGIQRFRINLKCKPYSTPRSVLLLFSLLLSLARVLRTLLPFYFHICHLRKS